MDDLFQPYEADPATVREAGQAALDQDAALRSTGDTAVRRAQRASSETSGLLPAETSHVADGARDSAYELAGAALLAGGALTQFADAIDDYNGGVEDLNDRWREAGPDFGVGADAGAEPGMTDAERSQARAGEVSSARQALRTELEGEERKLKADLDEAGDLSAGKLKDGPNENTLAYYVMTGSIPPSAVAAHTRLSVPELEQLKRLFTSALAGNKLRKGVLPMIHYLSQTDLKKAADLVQADWNRLIANMDDVDGPPLKQLKVWMQDHADFLSRKATYLKDGSLLRTSRMTNLLYDGSKLAKVAGPLAVIGGGLQIYDTMSNWDELSVKDRTLNMTSGVLGTASGLGSVALMAGVAIPGVGPAILVGAGLVAAGITIYQNWDTITDVAGDVVDNVDQFVSDAGERVSDLADSAKDAVSGAAEGAVDKAKDVAGDVGDVFGL